MKKHIAIMSVLILLMIAFNAQAFTVFYDPVANKQEQYKILYVLPDISEKKVNVASFDEKDNAELLDCLIEWNINRHIDRYFVVINPDGTKSLIENKEFLINMPYKDIASVCKPAAVIASKAVPVNDKIALTVNEVPLTSAEEATYLIQQLYKNEQVQWAFGWIKKALQDKTNQEIYQSLKADMSKDAYSKSIINMIDSLITTTKVSECPPRANKDNCESKGCKECPDDEMGEWDFIK